MSGVSSPSGNAGSTYIKSCFQVEGAILLSVRGPLVPSNMLHIRSFFALSDDNLADPEAAVADEDIM